MHPHANRQLAVPVKPSNISSEGSTSSHTFTGFSREEIDQAEAKHLASIQTSAFEQLSTRPEGEGIIVTNPFIS
jgi:hypothetical protein